MEIYHFKEVIVYHPYLPYFCQSPVATFVTFNVVVYISLAAGACMSRSLPLHVFVSCECVRVCLLAVSVCGCVC